MFFTYPVPQEELTPLGEAMYERLQVTSVKDRSPSTRSAAKVPSTRGISHPALAGREGNDISSKVSNVIYMSILGKIFYK